VPSPLFSQLGRTTGGGSGLATGGAGETTGTDAALSTTGTWVGAGVATGVGAGVGTGVGVWPIDRWPGLPMSVTWVQLAAERPASGAAAVA
jgi:hypothetical protein